jgi:uncharacterized membrane protein YgdD (TMEM256/DUF423 family)
MEVGGEHTSERAAGLMGPLGAVSGFLAVAAGAFGAHALRDRLEPSMLQAFETAARYQLVHAVAAVLVAVVPERRQSLALIAAGWLFLAGAVLFSGSLYALALTGVRAWGIVTPLGGLCFMAGWLTLAIGLSRRGAGNLHRN